MPEGKVDNVDKLVSKKLRMRRIFLGLSQKDIAKELKVTIQQVQKYEKSVNRISSGRLYVLAKFLKVPLDYFFTESDAASGKITEQLKKLPDGEKASGGSDTITELEIVKLIKAYTAIKNPNLRKKFAALITEVAR